ncbi:MAG: trans-aconitate 2-methyltransferase [Akkermansiaceae bacterium]
MKPDQTGKAYDGIASWWRGQHGASIYGIEQLKRAIGWVSNKGTAIDVGCGSSGRFIRVLLDSGFRVEGIDVSKEMITQARELHPQCAFEVADVAAWEPNKMYDLVCAWDSTFHLPLDLQESALHTMCDALTPGGVLIFSCGGNLDGVDGAGEVTGSFQGKDFEYSTLGVAEFLRLLQIFKLTVRHVEYDRGPTEPHVYIIAQRPA